MPAMVLRLIEPLTLPTSDDCEHQHPKGQTSGKDVGKAMNFFFSLSFSSFLLQPLLPKTQFHAMRMQHSNLELLWSLPIPKGNNAW
jgi:hypothetical protein